MKIKYFKLVFLNIFSNKQTCGYCQDVIRRVRNGSINVSFNKDIGEVKGKPIKNGENIPKDIIPFIDELLTNPLKCQGN